MQAIVSGRPKEKYTVELKILLTKEQKEHLTAIAEECGTKGTNVIRWLIEDEFDRNEDIERKKEPLYSQTVGVKISRSQDDMLTKLINKYNIDRSTLIRMLIEEDYERRFGNGE